MGERAGSEKPRGVGGWLAPPRFLMFLGLAALLVPAGVAWLGWSRGIIAGFDGAALAFLVSMIPLLRESDPDAIVRSAQRNDANRALMLTIGAFTSLAVLAAVAAELAAKGSPEPRALALAIGSLAIGWLFANTLYALHYAHSYYVAGRPRDGERTLEMPGDSEPLYWDFAYFAFTLGMTFQTSDVAIRSAAVRRVALGHCLIAFVFNLGVVGFVINVLGGVGG